MNAQTLELAPLLARRELWLLISAAFVDPYYEQRISRLRDGEFRRRAIDGAALLVEEHPALELGAGEVPPMDISPRAFFAAFDAETETLEASYRRVFGLTAISQRCPPCEIEFEPNTDIAYRSQRLADIAGFYEAFGLQVSNQTGERLDHITVEAEFLYLLLAKEAAALHVGNRDGAEVCRDARRKFFQEHVGWWVPAFARLLGHVTASPYYRRLARLTAGVSAIERVSLGLPRFEARITPKPSSVQAEATCFGCAGRP